jgi:leucyl-tRNA---protein transferase
VGHFGNFVHLKDMFAEVNCPEILASQELDKYLERGWFRMGQTIFTTNFLNFKNNLYAAIWLRLPLASYSEDKTQLKLFKKNSPFRIKVQAATVTPEKEILFSNYRQSISFEASASIQTLLFGKSNTRNIYNTREISLYDDNKLIAVGYFDLGEKSAAGISSFYDPAYKKYSLGKYLIYLKIEYCKKLGLDYFYPGYFVPGYSLFDYKLDIGKSALEYLDFTSSKWKSIAEFSNALTPLQQMLDKLDALQQLLWQNGVESKILKYEFFDANLIPELEGIVLFDFPVFLLCSGLAEETPIVFDVRDGRYHWVNCKSVWTSSTGNTPPDLYSSHVFKSDHAIYSTEMPDLMVSAIFNEMNAEGNMRRAKSM